MATHFSILAWRIPWTEEPGRLQFTGSKELDTTECVTQVKSQLSLAVGHCLNKLGMTLFQSPPFFFLPVCSMKAS